MYGNNILNFQESTTILNAWTKKSGNLLNAPRICMYLLSSTITGRFRHKVSFEAQYSWSKLIIFPSRWLVAVQKLTKPFYATIYS